MNPPADDSRPKAKPGLAERIIDGEALIVNAEGGEILVLNECGALVWQLLDGSHAVGDIVKRVSDEFEVGEDEARTDVLDFLGQLRERGALDG